jgi:hypothetical protein
MKWIIIMKIIIINNNVERKKQNKGENKVGLRVNSEGR